MRPVLREPLRRALRPMLRKSLRSMLRWPLRPVWLLQLLRLLWLLRPAVVVTPPGVGQRHVPLPLPVRPRLRRVLRR